LRQFDPERWVTTAKTDGALDDDSSCCFLNEENLAVPNPGHEQTAEEGIESEGGSRNASNPAKDPGLVTAAIDDVVANFVV